MRKQFGDARPSLQVLSRAAAIAVFLTILLPGQSHALPMFSRQVGRDCTFCHTLLPKLNETGRTFMANGFRFEGEEAWKDVRDWSAIPVSFETEVEAVYLKKKSGGVRSELDNLEIEEAELSAGGAMGKAGKVSALGMIVVQQTNSGYNTILHHAFVQVNDLVGPVGVGELNLRAGQWSLGLPFLDPSGSPISDTYLADTVLDAITPGQRGVELNGSVLAQPDSYGPTHRYSVGVTRQDLNGNNRLAGYYASYSATFLERFSVGALYRGGREQDGADDVTFNKYGLAGEAEAGPVVLTLGYFREERNSLPGRNDYLAEALYLPLPKVSFAARYEYLKQSGSNGVKSLSVMTRYNILSNVYTQLELKGLRDTDHVAGVNEDEKRARLFLAAVF